MQTTVIPKMRDGAEVTWEDAPPERSAASCPLSLGSHTARPSPSQLVCEPGGIKTPASQGHGESPTKRQARKFWGPEPGTCCMSVTNVKIEALITLGLSLPILQGVLAQSRVGCEEWMRREHPWHPQGPSRGYAGSAPSCSGNARVSQPPSTQRGS